MDRAEKQEEIRELTDSLQKTKVTLCADYRGLTVAKVTELRKLLREKGARARVVKNTLARLSAKSVLGENGSAEVDKFLGSIEGTTMMIFSETDPVSPAKVLHEFAKTNEKLQLRSGWLEGKFLDANGVTELAKMPGREETLAKLLALINTPATQLLRLMSTPGRQMATVIDAHRQNLEKKA